MIRNHRNQINRDSQVAKIPMTKEIRSVIQIPRYTGTFSVLYRNNYHAIRKILSLSYKMKIVMQK